MFRSARSRATLGLFVLVIAGCGTHSTRPSERSTRPVEITVQDSLGAAVVGARVLTRSETERWETNFATTDARGTVRFRLPLAFTVIGLAPDVELRAPRGRTAGTTFDLGTLAGTDTVRRVLTLHTASVATGHVRIPGTTNQRAFVYRLEDLPLVAVMSDSVTGAYQLDRLPIGHWYLRAEHPDHTFQTIQVDVSTPGSVLSIPDFTFTP